VGEDALAVAERLFAAIEAGDLDAVRSIYAESVEVWHNTGRDVQTRDENLRVLGWVVRNLHDRRYEEVRRSPTPDGFVQQHVLRAVRPDGQRVEIPACIVCRCDGGRITRLDEYLDSADVVRLTAR
jgi:ketosteroid isomerase-like protein